MLRSCTAQRTLFQSNLSLLYHSGSLCSSLGSTLSSFGPFFFSIISVLPGTFCMFSLGLPFLQLSVLPFYARLSFLRALLFSATLASKQLNSPNAMKQSHRETIREPLGPAARPRLPPPPGVKKACRCPAYKTIYKNYLQQSLLTLNPLPQKCSHHKLKATTQPTLASSITALKSPSIKPPTQEGALGLVHWLFLQLFISLQFT